LQAALAGVISLLRTRHNFFGALRYVRLALILLHQARPGKEGFDAAMLAAIAWWAGQFVRVVAPLARDAVGAGEDMTINDNARADAGAEDYSEHYRRTCRGTIRGSQMNRSRIVFG